VARLHDEQGKLVAYYQLPYSFKSVANHARDGGLQDKYLSTVHPPVLGPAAATVTCESGSSSIHYPVPPMLRPSRWENVEGHPPSFGFGSRKNMQQLEAGDQPLLQKVAPIEGPTQGGLKIVLIGTNFPTWPTTVYARFGSTVAPTVSHSVLLHILGITPPYSPG
jgi:hypothetical protein